MTAWFRRSKQKILSTERKDLASDLWSKCPSCSEYIYRQELERAQFVCPTCAHHFPIRCRKYIDMLLDGPESITELNPDLISVDPLDFKARKKYKDQLIAAREKTGLSEAVVTVTATIEGYPLVLAVMDFSFIGGSMGSAVGEKISRAIDYAREHRYALAIISSSGGARMQEGALSLMQMAKSSAKLSLFSQAGGLYISILTDPTTGGVTASFAMLGDIILAEPGALIGFAGARVIKQTIGEDLPEGFQRAEFLLEKGFVDHIVPRSEMKATLAHLIGFFGYERATDTDQ
ncbi:MAG: acetyl-CoA carboxylase carboxyltransferase subunit beta [Candidatus Marinimicrobia bacterium]|nr:acetyl-CoA carboxylase carboxyltransferase subunit beta [Candidatus Neomarinimicrobiota bacterium]MCH8023979.1 acetyl-CoA carboxylase carboxyltransferase subunit beta [Candidatus Neomarinimicrobiota bacterium]